MLIDESNSKLCCPHCGAARPVDWQRYLWKGKIRCIACEQVTDATEWVVGKGVYVQREW